MVLLCFEVIISGTAVQAALAVPLFPVSQRQSDSDVHTMLTEILRSEWMIRRHVFLINLRRLLAMLALKLDRINSRSLQ